MVFSELGSKLLDQVVPLTAMEHRNGWVQLELLITEAFSHLTGALFRTAFRDALGHGFATVNGMGHHAVDVSHRVGSVPPSAGCVWLEQNRQRSARIVLS